MKYLLTTGKVTSNMVEYIKDIFRLYLMIRIDEIPYWNGGTEDLIFSMDEGEILSQAKSVVNSIIEYIRTSISTITIILDSIEMIDSSIRIIITINGIKYNYVINRSN